MFAGNYGCDQICLREILRAKTKLFRGKKFLLKLAAIMSEMTQKLSLYKSTQKLLDKVAQCPKKVNTYHIYNLPFSRIGTV